MTLTLRANGNIIDENWFNEYYNLLTGTTADQPVKLHNGLVAKAVTFTTPTAPSLALHAGSGMGTGSYTAAIGFKMGDGLTVPGSTATISTTSGNNQISHSSIPLGPTGTTARVVYRSKVGTSTPLYKVAEISDNTTTTYLDSTADASLTVLAPSHNSFGGYIQIQDASGNVKAELYADGSIYLDAGAIFSDGTGILSASTLLTTGGKLGRTSVGDIIDASGADTVFSNRGTTNTWHFKQSDGSEKVAIGNSTFELYKANVSTPSNFTVGVAFGVKNSSGTKLFEIKSNGNSVISGTQYGTSSGSVSTASGQSFDSFDVAEVYPTDNFYPSGTILCPGPNNRLTQCTHDNCPFCMVASGNPGLLLGTPSDPQDHPTLEAVQLSVALAGRVNIRTAFDISPRTFVVSDGRGGVRPAAPGEQAHVIGFTLNQTSNISGSPQVGVILKSIYGVVV